MNTKITHIILTFFIALVWLINGLFVKVLNLAPRHQDIVSQVLGSEHANTFTITIGLLEILMAVWVISRFKIKTNAITQILIVLTMNTIEFTHAQELLMWGKLNFVFAVLFCVMVYYNAFVLSIKK
ncbi:DoxX-like family protein [uncultured Algibacter sp.]|uniref:DoxX-like family protein n=1 Tax=uncultured Algibacter sp. TaxID=298659 RepID=UPI0032172E8E